MILLVGISLILLGVSEFVITGQVGESETEALILSDNKCSDQGFIIRGMAYEANESSIKAYLSIEGGSRPGFTAILDYGDRAAETRWNLQVMTDEKGEFILISDVSADIKKVTLISEECTRISDWMDDQFIVGLDNVSV
jgi:hypothetical protein